MLGPCFGLLVLGLVLGFYLIVTDRVGILGFVGVALGSGVVGLLLGLLMYGAIGVAAGGLIRMVTGAGNLPPARPGAAPGRCRSMYRGRRRGQSCS